MELIIPPLRERTGDIPLLARYFIEMSIGPKHAREIRISPELSKVFSLYSWRGNIRELKNVLTFALYNLQPKNNTLTIDHLPDRFLQEMRSNNPNTIELMPSGEGYNLAKAGADAERKVLISTLINTKYNKTLTAKALGVSRNKLYKKMREFGLHSPNN